MREKDLLLCLGRQIQRFRKDAKLTQQQLGDRVGLSYISIGKLERGETFTSLGTLFAIAKALNRSLPELFEWAPKNREDALESAFDRLRKLVSVGEAPTLDDLEMLLAAVNPKKTAKPMKSKSRLRRL